MKTILKKIWVALVFVAMIIPVNISTSFAADREYKITFKSGSQGVFNISDLGKNATYNDKHTSVTYTVKAGEAFPDVPELIINEGYRNNMWSDELPVVGSKVTEKQVYVAKYTKLVNGVEFTVKYVDTNGVEIATPTIYTTDLGTEEVVRAKTVEGYQPDSLQKRLVVSRENVEIQFVYTSTEQATEAPVIEQIVYVEGEPVYVDVVQPGATVGTGTTTAGTTTGGGAAAAGTTDTTGEAGAGTTDIEDNETPQAGAGDDTTTIEDNETPQAGASDSQNNTALYVGGGIGAVAVLALIAYLLSKRKKQETE